MKIIRINNQKDLEKYHESNIKQNKFNSLNSYDNICTKPLVILLKDGKIELVNRWFISNKNELIFDIKHNKWINLGMYEADESTVATEINALSE